MVVTCYNNALKKAKDCEENDAIRTSKVLRYKSLIAQMTFAQALNASSTTVNC